MILCFIVLSDLPQLVCFSVSGEYLTARIRSRVFRAILRQVWFEVVFCFSNAAYHVQDHHRSPRHGIAMHTLKSHAVVFACFCIIVAKLAICKQLKVFSLKFAFSPLLPTGDELV